MHIRVLAVCFIALWPIDAMAQDKTAGRIGIWTSTPTPNSLTDTGNATAPGNFTINGNLNVLGTVSGNFPAGSIPAGTVVTDNKTGPIAVDGAAFIARSQSGVTAHDIWQYLFGTEGIGFYDALRGVTVVTQDSPTVLVSAVSGYVLNRQDPTLAASNQIGNAAALFGAGMIDVDHGRTWGINTIVGDCKTRAPCGRQGAQEWNEFDFHVNSPDTVVEGLVLAGAGYARPKLALGFTCESLDKFRITGGRWDNCFTAVDGTSRTAVYIGATRAGDDPARANTGSQQEAWAWYDGSSNRQLIYGEIDTTKPFPRLNWRTSHGGAGIGFDMTMAIDARGNAANSPSHSLYWDYIDNGGNNQDYSLTVNNQGILVLSRTGSNTFTDFAVNGSLLMGRVVTSGQAPGTGLVKLEVIEGTNSGTCRLIARGGSSQTPVIIADNIGANC